MTDRYLNLRAGDIAAEHVHAGDADMLTGAGVRIDLDFYDGDLELGASQQAAVDALLAVQGLICQGVDLPGAPDQGANVFLNVGLDSAGDWTQVSIDTADAAGFVCVRLTGGIPTQSARLAISAARSYVADGAWPTPITAQLNADALAGLRT